MYDLTTNYKSKLEKIEKLQSTGAQVPNNLQVDVQRLEKQVETEREKFDLLSNACKEEILLFEAQKAREVKQAIIALVQINIDHELMVSDLWKKMLSKMTR